MSLQRVNINWYDHALILDEIVVEADLLAVLRDQFQHWEGGDVVKARVVKCSYSRSVACFSVLPPGPTRAAYQSKHRHRLRQ
jgi:hypothetical protein